MAGLSVVMKGFAYDMDQLKEQMQFRSQGFIGAGLGLILLSSIPSLLAGKDFMTGLWISVPLPLNGTLKLGTPLLFDIGVFFAVIGVILMFLFSLKKGA